MVQDANAHGGVEMTVGEGQGAGVTQNEFEPGVSAQGLARGVHVNLGRIEQHDLAIAAVLVGEPAETCPDFDQPITVRRKQSADGDSVAGILISARGPEDVAVSQVFVGRDRAFRRMRLGAASLAQEGLEAPTARLWMAKSSALPDQPQSHRTTFVRAL